MGNRRGFDARRGGRGAGMETLVRMAGWFWLRLSLVRRSPRAGQPSRLVEIVADLLLIGFPVEVCPQMITCPRPAEFLKSRL